MKRIYVAGPLGPNDPGRALRIHSAICIGRELLELGHAPFVPHAFAATGIDGSASYEQMMSVCFAFLSTCDVLLRIPGASPGADREVVYAEAHGIAVCHSIAEVLGYIEGGKPADDKAWLDGAIEDGVAE